MPPFHQNDRWLAPGSTISASTRRGSGASGGQHRLFAFGGPSDAADEAADVFDRVNAINLRGIWACVKHELAQMRTQSSGSVVNCSSLGGLVGLPGRAAYHASKHGVIGLTKSAALHSS